MDEKLTDTEARQLIEMVKRSLEKEIATPSAGKKYTFEVEGDTEKHLFKIQIFRGKIDPNKVQYGALISKNGTYLLGLDLDEAAVHVDPVTGEKIIGSHWHVYTQNFGRRHAFPATDIISSDFVENTIKFLDKFHVIEKPEIIPETLTIENF